MLFCLGFSPVQQILDRTSGWHTGVIKLTITILINQTCKTLYNNDSGKIVHSSSRLDHTEPIKWGYTDDEVLFEHRGSELHVHVHVHVTIAYSKIHH